MSFGKLDAGCWMGCYFNSKWVFLTLAAVGNFIQTAGGRFARTVSSPGVRVTLSASSCVVGG
jgi:hypothetical protein|tara:strand:+ start:432 stop:617 length:186 start_codon:yes stop_codon:yes gene_type:complete